MSDLIEQSLGKLLSRACLPEVVAEARRSWPHALWSELDASGFAVAGVSQENGGAGGGWPEIVAVAGVAGRWAAPVPLPETVIARFLADRAGLTLPDGPITVTTGERLTVDARDTLTGTAHRVPWGRDAQAVLCCVEHTRGQLLVVADPTTSTIVRGANLAGEPRDAIRFDRVSADVALAKGHTSLEVAGALVRAAQIAGALARVLELSAEYARVREQFGRPIAKFQAVQDLLARLAGETAAARAAVDSAVDRDADIASVAAAKVRTAAAASEGARIAHQIHGATGVTYEHQLHNFTSRLWSWRDEFGGDRAWARRLGTIVTRDGAAGYWGWLTGTWP